MFGVVGQTGEVDVAWLGQLGGLGWLSGIHDGLDELVQ